MAEHIAQVGALALVQAYHERSKHRLGAYAAGPETLDWDAQPDPFRRFAGTLLTPLPLNAADEAIGWRELFEPGRPTRPATLAEIGRLFELSFALSAWKELGPDRWALRVNPSSGNLHPTEVYLIAQGLPDLTDGVYHYAPKAHALELRAAFAELATAPRLGACAAKGDESERRPQRGQFLPDSPPHSPAMGQEAGEKWTTAVALQPSILLPCRLLVGFSSIHWREAWKYGERAFRYCQLDLGHAVGALRYAAALLGWRVQELGLGHSEQAALMGLDRQGDFRNAEGEEAEAVFELCLDAANTPPLDPPAMLASASWFGQANRLDAHPMYRWPVIDAVAQASRRLTAVPTPALPQQARRTLLPNNQAKASQLIRQRRSAQRFDRSARSNTATLWPLLAALMPAGQLPWDMGQPAGVHAVLFAHRVDGLAPGAYLLPRNGSARSALQTALPQLAWRPVDGCPADIPLVELALNPALAGTLRTLSCHQAIGADAVFVIALLAELPTPVSDAPWLYRERLREAGLIGQVLYLEAEAAGLRGTGIGCFFDDPVRELLGLGAPGTEAWQVLYHFSVGLPVADARITSSPPYSEPRP